MQKLILSAILLLTISTFGQRLYYEPLYEVTNMSTIKRLITLENSTHLIEKRKPDPYFGDMVYCSVNDGVTWNPFAQGNQFPTFKTQYRSYGDSLIYAMYAQLLVTSDFGENWDILYEHAGNALDYHIVNADSIVLLKQNKMISTADGGDTWVTDTLSYNCKSFDISDSNNLYLHTEQGLYTKHLDDSIWTNIYAGKFDSLYCKNDSLLIIWDSTHINYSMDFGLHWDTLSPPSDIILYNVLPSGNNYLFVTTIKGFYKIDISTNNWEKVISVYCPNYSYLINNAISFQGQIFDSDYKQYAFKTSVHDTTVQDTSLYYPLEIGNEWLSISNSSTKYSDNISFTSKRIVNDTLINATRYFQFAPTGHCYRYDKTNQNYLRFDSDSNTDVIVHDFSTQNIINYSNSYIDSYLEIFDDNYRTKKIRYIPDYYSSTYREFVDKIGPYSYYYHYDNFILSFHSTSTDLLEALIHLEDTTLYYHNGTKPIISFYNPDTLSSLWFECSPEIKHAMNISPNGYHNGLSFIKSAIVEYFYQSEDSTTSKEVMKLVVSNETEIATGNITLSDTLISRDFTFHYRIVAVDKSIIPDTTYFPQKGFLTAAVKDGVTVIDGNQETLPTVYALHSNYPNPFNPVTTIQYDLPKPSFVTLTVYNTLGETVKTLVNSEEFAGVHTVQFDASNIPSGVYFYRLQANDYVETKKMLLIK